ncbi:MAG: hypothetical protein C4521_10955 [Actinobacteria bacterium]|nr:MAG: hypothetical protein C4521_10955 [Actinomycetota bacterium]
MKKLLAFILAVSLALIFAGCGGRADKNAGPGEDGTKSSVGAPEQEGQPETAETRLPGDFPSKFPIYSGAKAEHASKQSSGGYVVFTVAWKTKDSTREVADYYKKALPEAGYKVEQEFETNDTFSFVLETAATQSGSSVTISSEEGLTNITAIIAGDK